MTDRTPTPWADDDDGDHSAFTHRDDDEPPPYARTPTTLHETHVCRDCGAAITMPYVKAQARAPLDVAVRDFLATPIPNIGEAGYASRERLRAALEEPPT